CSVDASGKCDLTRRDSSGKAPHLCCHPLSVIKGVAMIARTAMTVIIAALAGCSALGGLTVKNYTAASGERVMAGQAEPKDEYRCRKLVQEEEDWGLMGNMDEASAMERVTR